MPTKQKTKTSKKPTKARKTSSRKKAVVKEEVVEEEVVEEEVVDDEVVDDEVVDDEVVEVKTVRKTKKVLLTPDDVSAAFLELVDFVNLEIESLRSKTGKVLGVKTLRSFNKRVKVLRSQTIRAMKKKRKINRKNNGNSGFMKKVPIAPEMAKFAGWDPADLRSRVEVTTYICDYVKKNELQDEKDRRNILADTKLSKLLNYNKAKDTPLTYWSLQTHMTKLFPKKKE